MVSGKIARGDEGGVRNSGVSEPAFDNSICLNDVGLLLRVCGLDEECTPEISEMRTYELRRAGQIAFKMPYGIVIIPLFKYGG